MRWPRIVSLPVFALLLAGECAAHSGRAASGEGGGLSFPSASHGELLVLSAYRSEIVDLARRVVDTNPDFRRLMNYAAIEYSYCGWGLAPRALSDEDSPFNECSHAYLSAEKELLLRMRDMPLVARQAGELIARIDADMVREGASFVGCQYSGEDFDTAYFVTPHWEYLWGHPPTVLGASGLAGAGLALVAACVIPWPKARRRRKPQADDPLSRSNS